MTPTPATVVLVHGAWHGAWCWDAVVAGLRARGVPARAIDLPGHGESGEALGDLAGDAAALRETLAGIDGPLVVCGHSYGGAVTSEGAGGNDRVRHLVFIAALALDVGESCMGVAGAPVDDAGAATELAPALQVDGNTTTLDPELAVSALYHDCRAEDAATAVARLGPQPIATLATVATRAAWRAVPSTYVVCSDDRAVPPSLQEVLARRATRTITWPTSHSPFLSRPELVVDLLADLAVEHGQDWRRPEEVTMADQPDTKTEYEAEARSALDKVRAQIDELRVQADLAGAEARDRLQAGVEALRKRQAEAKVKLDEAQSTGADTWKSVAKQAEQLVDDLGDALGKLADEVQAAVGAAGAAAGKGRDAFREEWRKSREQREQLLED